MVSAPLSFSMKGIEEAIANIRKVGDAVDEDVMREAAMEALVPVRDTAKSLAPVDKGDLRDGIEIRSSLPGEREGDTVYIGPFGPNAGHGWLVELGTVHMRAQPYLAPAFDAEEATVIDILGKNVGLKIEAAF